MKVLLISANMEEINMVTLPLGLGLVASSAGKAGHDVEFLDLLKTVDIYSAIEEAVDRSAPEVIGVSVRNVDDQNMTESKFLLESTKKIISACRNLSEAPIVLGGAGYSLFPETMLTYLDADMGIQGEGELAFSMLLDRLERGEELTDTPGLYLPGQGLQRERVYLKDLDQFPPPDLDITSITTPNDTIMWMPIQTSRGCPLDCSYCSTATIEGRPKRRRLPRSIIRDISLFIDKGVTHFYFIDNTFNLPPSHAVNICKAIIDSNCEFSFRCIIYPMRVNENLIKLMAQAGCIEVSLGFESGSEEILKWLNKKFTPDDVRRTNDLFVKHGIKRTGFLLIGAPGETKETVEQSLHFVDSLDLDLLKITSGIRIYPNTQLAKTALAEGVIEPDDDLLAPRFYMSEDIVDWLNPTLKEWMSERPHWIF